MGIKLTYSISCTFLTSVVNIVSRDVSPGRRQIELLLFCAVGRVTADDAYRDVCITLVNSNRNGQGSERAFNSRGGQVLVDCYG